LTSILIIEDEEVIRRSVARLLKRHGYQPSEAESVEEAELRYQWLDFDLIITDLRLPGLAGMEVLKRAKGVPVLVITSYASVRSAVEAMKEGAVDYIAKPFDHDELILTVQRILKQRQREQRSKVLESTVSQAYPVKGMIGDCQAMQNVCKTVAKVAPTHSTVLILGESGTGKELVARALHEQSTRAEAAIVTVNCAAIPETLVESELFGHEKGAFTNADRTRTGLVESADGGTLFLDEIGELPLAAQARLLRVLQNGEIRRVGSERSRNVNVRLVAATHRDLKQLVEEQRFRSDLYFRLRVMEITLPPLRQRGNDIFKLAELLLDKACRNLNRPALTLSAEALSVIGAYHWPGNVRELENTMERAVILSEGRTIHADLLNLETPKSPQHGHGETDAPVSLDDYFLTFVRENEQQMTETELAKRLGISRKSLWERRQRMGIPRAKKGR
jgi:DNA-binding NtrC family response regulator